MTSLIGGTEGRTLWQPLQVYSVASFSIARLSDVPPLVAQGPLEFAVRLGAPYGVEACIPVKLFYFAVSAAEVVELCGVKAASCSLELAQLLNANRSRLGAHGS